MWVTLWYAGFVVMTMGYPEMTLDSCNRVKMRVEYDIWMSYEDPELSMNLLNDGLYKEGWKVTCEMKNMNPEI